MRPDTGSFPSADRLPRILFIDAYDSFTYNIVSLVETTLNVSVTVIKIDSHIEDLTSLLGTFDAVIAGPGPGHPATQNDVGLFRGLWRLDDEDLLPVLGICLGFQSLVLEFGGEIIQLPEPRHGMLRRIRTDGEGIFEGIEGFTAVQYHSLYADLDTESGFMGRKHDGVNGAKVVQDQSPLVALAWDMAIDNVDKSIPQQDKNPETILMAVRHGTKPFCGVQFHPESVCSDKSCGQIISNWWRLVVEWNSVSRFDRRSQQAYVDAPKTYLTNSNATVLKQGAGSSCNGSDRETSSNMNGRHKRQTVATRCIKSASPSIPQICERLDLLRAEVIVLDSEQHQRAEVGRFSIIGIVDEHTLKLEYKAGQSIIRQRQGVRAKIISLESYGGSVFNFLKSFMAERKVTSRESSIPFWGGLMGHITYEACLETLDIKSCANPVDVGFAFVERSIVIDHEQGEIFVQSLRDHDMDWIESTFSLLATSNPFGPFKTGETRSPNDVSLPQSEDYRDDIRACQTLLRKGESYELCLTTEAQVKLPSSTSPWSLYLTLRETNPAPFAAYLKLGPLTHISSSPERFLSWTRPSRHSASSSHPNHVDRPRIISTCQFRPIKGTVKRFPHGPNGPLVTLAQATEMLATPKEKAENLMIVDLIRHDLHGVVGSGNVRVPKLMAVEEYGSLFQLVTVVEGDLHVHGDEDEEEGTGESEEEVRQLRVNGHTSEPKRNCEVGVDDIAHCGQYKLEKKVNDTGIDVLAASLPPGSMTGAPKRRSCALLQEIEQRNRGVYSGVLGYMDVGGGGDFSVVIRSAFSWDEEATTNIRVEQSGGDEERGMEEEEGRAEKDEVEEGKGERTWTIGAGGAVTCLSTEEGEWEEMCGKLNSTLGAFVGEGT